MPRFPEVLVDVDNDDGVQFIEALNIEGSFARDCAVMSRGVVNCLLSMEAVLVPVQPSLPTPLGPLLSLVRHHLPLPDLPLQPGAECLGALAFAGTLEEGEITEKQKRRAWEWT